MKIIATIGDCNGIGIEVLVKALKKNSFDEAEISIAGNSQTIAEYVTKAKLDARIEENFLFVAEKKFSLLDCGNYSSIEFGEEKISAGRLAFAALEYSIERLLSGEFDAVVTMPVSKNSLQLAGFGFPGQTEFFAKRCNVANPVMILATKKIRVALVTIHIPLRNVSEKISSGLLEEKILSLKNSLQKDFSISEPKIAVLGLNPHAGENGLIGDEEEKIISPLIKRFSEENSSEENFLVKGPFPADGFFAHGSYKNYDGILAMYHDQGLIPLKILANGGGVNFTAGLPVVRTSPDHGTAFAIAGKNCANEQSVVDAFEMAIEICKSRQNFSQKKSPAYEF